MKKQKYSGDGKLCKMGQNLTEEESFWFYFNQSSERGQKENASKVNPGWFSLHGLIAHSKLMFSVFLTLQEVV